MNERESVATEGNDPVAAAERLGDLIDQMVQACPDAVILVGMIVNTCDPVQSPRTQQYQSLIPGVVQRRLDAGKHVIAVSFTSFPTSSLQDCIHPTNAGYRELGHYWHDFLTQVPERWIKAPVGDDPDRPEDDDDADINKNGGMATNIPDPDWGTSPVKPSSKDAVKRAFDTAGEGGPASCNVAPQWHGTGQIAVGLGRNGDWKYKKHWVSQGKVADGIHRDPKYVRYACFLRSAQETQNARANANLLSLDSMT